MNRTKKRKDRRMLVKQGFDLSAYDEVNQTWVVQCSKCKAMVINGCPCHMVGCPNIVKK